MFWFVLSPLLILDNRRSAVLLIASQAVRKLIGLRSSYDVRNVNMKRSFSGATDLSLLLDDYELDLLLEDGGSRFSARDSRSTAV